MKGDQKIVSAGGGLYSTEDGAPCPFCAYRGALRINWRYVAWVECPKCHACGPTTSRGDADPLWRALDLWNEAAREEIA